MDKLIKNWKEIDISFLIFMMCLIVPVFLWIWALVLVFLEFIFREHMWFVMFVDILIFFILWMYCWIKLWLEQDRLE